MGSTPPVEIKGDTVDVIFHSDGSTVGFIQPPNTPSRKGGLVGIAAHCALS